MTPGKSVLGDHRSDTCNSNNNEEVIDFSEDLIIIVRGSNPEDDKIPKIRDLISKGADVNFKDANRGNNTPLHAAVRKGEINVVKLLLDNGASVNNVNNKGETTLDVAKSSKTAITEDIIDILDFHANNFANSSFLVEKKHTHSDKNVNERLQNFVSYFVQSFESKLVFLQMLAEANLNKFGRFPGVFSGKVGPRVGGSVDGFDEFFLGSSPTGTELGDELEHEGAGLSGAQTGEVGSRKEVFNILDLADMFQNDKIGFRNTLVETAVDIFQSFEMQLMRMTTDEGSKSGMFLLAKEAANRGVNYFMKNRECVSISQAVLLGESKREPVFNLPFSAKPGFSIQYEYQSVRKEWRTTSLFEKVGLVHSEIETSDKYFKKLDGTSKTGEYGYRRLLREENWENMTEKYESDNIVESESRNFTVYQYTLNSENVIENSHILLGCLKLEPPQYSILEDIALLKTEVVKHYRKDKELITRLGGSLTSLNVNDHLEKFEQLFPQVDREPQNLEGAIETVEVENIQASTETDTNPEKEISPVVTGMDSGSKRDLTTFDIKESVTTFTGENPQLKGGIADIQSSSSHTSVNKLLGLSYLGISEPTGHTHGMYGVEGLPRNVKDTLETFVSYFVQIFELKRIICDMIVEEIIENPERLIYNPSEKSNILRTVKRAAARAAVGAGATVGAGAGAVMAAGAVVAAVPVIAAGAVVGAAAVAFPFWKVYQSFKRDSADRNETPDAMKYFVNSLGLVDSLPNDKANSRKMLVEAAFDIFQSFELQFMLVTTDDESNRAVLLLAKDAASRAANYFMKNREDVSISQAVLLGQSKIEPIFDIPLPLTSDFKIKYQHHPVIKEWRTASLYENVGLVIPETEAAIKYFKKRNGTSRTVKYGYRRLLRDENWEDLRDNYEADNIAECESSQIIDYLYTLNTEKSAEIVNDLLSYLKNTDVCLEERRMREILEDVRRGIFEDVNYLKKQTEDHRILLTCIEESLQSLNVKDCLRKYELYFEEADKGRQKHAGAIAKEKKDSSQQVEQKFKHYNEEICEIKALDASKIEKSQNRKSVWFDIRESVPNFTGRQEEIAKINTLIHKGIVVISGLNGVGKTELATKYARSYFSDKDNIIWINSGTRDSAIDSFRRLLKELGSKRLDSDGEQMSLQSMAKEAYSYFTGGNSLFIFDNAQSYYEVSKFLPVPTFNYVNKIFVLITSPTIEGKFTGVGTATLPLSNFTKEESFSFTKKAFKVKDNAEDADISFLAEKMHNFPLALQQAVTYIKDLNEEFAEQGSQFNVNDYLKKYDQITKKLLKAEIPDENVQTVIKTLEVIVDKIKSHQKHGKEAMDMLSFIAYLAPNNIPQEIFLEQVANGDKEKLISVTNLLKKYSIVSSDKSILSVHGMVQQVVRLDLENTKFEGTSMQEIILSNLLLLLKDQMADRAIAESYIPHITSIWNHAMKYGKLIEQFIVNNLHSSDVYTTYFHLIAGSTNYKLIDTIIRKIDPAKLSKVIELRNKDKGVPLHNAALSGHGQIMRLLIEKGADVNAVKYRDWTPLLLAAANGHLEVVELLLENNANVNAKTNKLYTAVHFSSTYGYFYIVEALLRANADVTARTMNEDTPLHLAAGNPHSDIANIVRGKVTNFSDMSIFKLTPSQFDTESERLRVVNVLLTKKANVNAINVHGYTPLHLAVESEYSHIVRSLLKNGAKANIQDTNHCTPLHWAAIKGNVTITDLLLKCGSADVDLQTATGNTALHLAARQGHYETVKVLLLFKATVNIENKEGNTALDLARQRGHPEVEKCIAKHKPSSRFRAAESKPFTFSNPFNR